VKKSEPPTAKETYEMLLCDRNLEWTLETRLREFQYKLLNRIIFANKLLFKIGEVDSSLCVFDKKKKRKL
jgi:hypothetical protein